MERREEMRACISVFRAAAGPSAEELLRRWIELIERLEGDVETEKSGERA